ncbi:hypothetical protein BDB01DRAFT_833595 [Pilobolus umbonatus]|nr:hypothetical protein BDB01DRAFT_833595 [Pilobolus umbonatus]
MTTTKRDRSISHRHRPPLEEHNYSKEQVAMTLTAECTKHNNTPITLLHSDITFKPFRSWRTSVMNKKAFIHYEPKKGQVILGTNPDSRHSNRLKMTLEQYAWLIQQLEEEEVVHNEVDYLLCNPSQQKPQYSHSIPSYSSILGIINTDNEKRSLKHRLKQFVRWKKPSHIYHIFLLPKPLILQAANYIPMTKPLPPPVSSINHELLSMAPYSLLTEDRHRQLLRYAHHVSLCNHELLLPVHKQTTPSIPTPPSSLLNKKDSELCPIRCVECSVKTGLLTLVQPPVQSNFQPLSSISTTAYTSAVSDQTQNIMFPISFIKFKNTIEMSTSNTLLNNETRIRSSAIPTESAFNGNIRENRKSVYEPRAVSALQYIPPEDTSSLNDSESECSFIQSDEEDEEHSECSDDNEDDSSIVPEQYGYVAVDVEEEEILVIFPGMSISSTMFEDISFHPVEWHEIYSIIKSERAENSNNDERSNDEDDVPCVLESALIAWNKCEMKVVTLLMRLCNKLPSHYKVVIIGYSLGGAVASLCAFSLRSTQLLTDRRIEVYAYHPPRVGNRLFVNILHNQVSVTRITDHRDLMAHLPPRTSGLTHAGQKTVITPWDHAKSANRGYSLSSTIPDQTEDILSRTFSHHSYDTQSHLMAWNLLLHSNSHYCT